MAETGREEVSLSVCVIGRNESASIPRLAASLQPLTTLPLAVETIFVDSASTDDSPDVARAHFDRVFELEYSANLCASAGRYVAALEAVGRWLLFLDADMELREEFVECIENTIAADSGREGIVGIYRNIYPHGGVRENVLRHTRNGGVVDQFGGAVLLPREAVMKAGNWNPRVFSNEEIDLYTRLRGAGCVVRYVSKPMVSHRTQEISRWRMLFNCFVPTRNGLGKKFYGIGQVLAARIRERSFCSFVRFFPYPFVYWACLLLAVAFLCAGWAIAGAVALLAGIVYVLKTKGLNFVALYLAFVVQAALGWRRYDKTYVPVYTNVNTARGAHS